MMRCWFFKRTVSHAADADRHPDRLTQWHLSRCQDCQQFHAECRLLGQRLRHDAHVWDRASEPVPMPVTRQRDRNTGLSALTHVAIAAGIAIIVSLGVFLATRPAAPITPANVPVVANDPVAPPQRSWTRFAGNPLTNEVRSLADEAEAGVLFLVACLDVSPLTGDTDAPVE